MALRPMSYRLKWPHTPHQQEGLDEMLQILFKATRALEVQLGDVITNVTSLTLTAGLVTPIAVGSIPGNWNSMDDSPEPAWPGAGANFQSALGTGYVPYTGAIKNVDLGTFTLTTPTVIGGTAVGSSLTLQSTGAVGTTDYINFLVGNNGATEAVRILHSGLVGIGTTPVTYGLDVEAGGSSSAKFGAVSPFYFISNDPILGFNMGYTSPNFVFGKGSIAKYGGSIGFSAASGGFEIHVSTTTGNADATATRIQRVFISQLGKFGISEPTPTAFLHLVAGTTAATTAPLKFNSGSLLTTPEAGTIEFLTDKFYGGITTGPARRTFAFLESPTFTGTVNATTIVAAGNISVGTGAQFIAVDGAVGATAYSFSSAAGLGIYVPFAGGYLGIANGGVNNYLFGPSGNFYLSSLGKVQWTTGATNAATDLMLQRSAAKTLTVDDGAAGAAQLKVTGVITSHLDGTAQRLDIGATGDTGSSSQLRLFQDSTHYNWQIGAGIQANDTLSFTPSTAVNGTTFSSPLFTIAAGGTTSLNTHTVAAATGDLFGIDHTGTDAGVTNDSYIRFKTAGTTRYYVGISTSGATGNWEIYGGALAFSVVKTTANILIGKLITGYNGITTVSNGVPAEYADINTTGLTANVGATTLYSVPSTGAGMYRVSAYVVETTAGSLSSTLPNVQIVYTDVDSNTSITLDVTPILGIAGIGQTGALTANTVGTVSSGVVPIYVKLSTTIQYQTVNYASNLAGMAYALHIKLEAL